MWWRGLIVLIIGLMLFLAVLCCPGLAAAEGNVNQLRGPLVLHKLRGVQDWILTKLEGTERGRRTLRMLNYRKFAIAILALGLTTTVLLLGKLDAQTFGEVFTWVVGLYIGGNGIEHLAKRRTETVTTTQVSSKPAEAQEETIIVSKPAQEPAK